MDKKLVAPFIAAYEFLLAQGKGLLAYESADHAEMAWLKQARAAHFNHWSVKGLPTRRSERWKYTSLASLENAKVLVPTVSSALSLEGGMPDEFGTTVVFMNGRFAPSASALPKENGISVLVLSDFLAERERNGWTEDDRKRLSGFKKLIERPASEDDVFHAMNTSFLQDAVVINVDSKSACDRPVLLYFISDVEARSNDDLPIINPRVFINVEADSEFSVMELYSGADSSGPVLVNAQTDIELAAGAKVDYCKVQTQPETALHVGTTRVRQHRNSSFESSQFAIGGKLAREELYIHLAGEGAEASFSGFYFSRKKQHIDNYTLVEHAVPHTTSQQMYKGILDDEARAVFNGHVRIRRDAQKSNAAQINKNLMLSRKAEVDTRPELEIDADDVKASHGATIGQIDPEHVYYLQSRGISRHEAVKMLSHGFAQEVVFKMRNPILRSLAREIVEENLAFLEGADV